MKGKQTIRNQVYVVLLALLFIAVLGFGTVSAEASTSQYDRMEQVVAPVGVEAVFGSPFRIHKEFTLDFDANGGSGKQSAVFSSTGSIKLPKCRYTKTGYHFTGWKIGTHVYSAGSDFPCDSYGSTTATAQWAANSYTIVFEDNNGTGTQSPINTTYGKTVTLPACSFTRKGYTFAGWKIKDTVYNAGDQVKNLCTGGQVMATAQWKAKTYTIAFASNNGTGTMSSITVRYDEARTLPKCTFSKQGYSCTGWSWNGNTYANEASVKNLTDKNGVTLTFTAQWKVNSYTIVFGANGGTGTQSPINTTYGATVTLPECSFTRKGYSFAGWKINGKVYKAGEKVTNLCTGGQVTATAQWKAKTYTVTFKNGSTTVATRKVTYGSTYGTLPIHTEAGYNAADWYTATSGGTKITSSTKVTITADQTLYARWNSPKTFKISFNGNGGPNVPPQTATYGKTYGSLPILVRSSYDFLGWYTALSGGNKITSSTIVTITADQTLYAHWKRKNVYTVSVTADGTTNKYAVSAGNGFTFPSEPTTAPDGKRFYGWSLYRDGVLDSGYYLPGGTVAIHSDCTVYPKYETIYEKLGTVDGWEIWIVQPDAEKQFDKKHSGQLIKIIDGKDFHGMPDYCIRNSWMFTDHSFKTAVCKLIVNYNKRMGRTIYWDRSVTGCVDEWAEHNLIYAVTMGGAKYIDFLGDMNHSARDVDLDASGDGYIPAQILNLIKALLP